MAAIRKRSQEQNKTISTNRGEREATPYDHLWLNIGVETPAPTDEDENATKFIRLPRGVAVSDLAPKATYANMSDEFRGEVTLMNQVIEAIQNKGLNLKAGESVSIALEVQLYARAEEQTEVPVVDNKELSAQLFGEREVA